MTYCYLHPFRNFIIAKVQIPIGVRRLSREIDILSLKYDGVAENEGTIISGKGETVAVSMDVFFSGDEASKNAEDYRLAVINIIEEALKN